MATYNLDPSDELTHPIYKVKRPQLMEIIRSEAKLYQDQKLRKKSAEERRNNYRRDQRRTSFIWPAAPGQRSPSKRRDAMLLHTKKPNE